MRLAPITRPRSLVVRIAAFLSRRRYGRVLSVISCIYARMPRLLRPQLRMLRFAEKELSLEPRLRHLVSVLVSLENGCSFCGDLHGREATSSGVPLDVIRAVPRFETADVFSDRERAALAWALSVARTRRGDDGAFAELRQHFDERAILELTWLVAFTTYLNTLAVPLGLESDGLCSIALTPPRPVSRIA